MFVAYIPNCIVNGGTNTVNVLQRKWWRDIDQGYVTAATN